MKKYKLVTIFTLLLMGCGREQHRVPLDSPPNQDSVDSIKGLQLTCSSSSSDNSLECTNGTNIVLPATFPPSTNCNQCVTTIDTASPPVAHVNCPNGFQFTFTLVQGPQGPQGPQGIPGVAASCTVTSAGKFSCSDGTSYQIPPGAPGPKGDKGEKGDKGDPGLGCSISKNNLGQQVITCGNTSQVLSGCGGNGCWSFGAKGNVFTLPTTATSVNAMDTLTPEETIHMNQFNVPNTSSNVGWPNNPTRKSWFGIKFTGFIQIPSCPSNKCYYRLTSDDGSTFSIDDTPVISNDGLHAISSVTGFVLASPGWHSYTLNFFQGPPNFYALKLEVSLDNGNTYNVVSNTDLKYIIN